MGLDTTPFLMLGLMLPIGFASGLLAERFGLPRVAAYVVVGAAFSPDILGGLLGLSTQPWGAPTTDAALGVVAFLIGAELHLKQLHKLGGATFGAVAGQSLGAVTFVSLGLWAYSHLEGTRTGIGVPLVLGAIATATAPAATIAIINEYKAKGPVSTMLLGIVALDDAVGVILFSVATGIAAAAGLWDSFGRALIEIVGSIAVGAALGALLGMLGRKIHSEEPRLAPIIGVILASIGLATVLELSSLLTCMTLGFVSKVLFGQKTENWLAPLNDVREVLFLVFFTLAGAHFHVEVFLRAWDFILVYMAARVAGKYGGVILGTRLAGVPASTGKHLGMALMPQAGVAVGLALLTAKMPALSPWSPLILNAILGSTIVFELTAPILTKLALQRSGEIP